MDESLKRKNKRRVTQGKDWTSISLDQLQTYSGFDLKGFGPPAAFTSKKHVSYQSIIYLMKQKITEYRFQLF